MQSLEARLLDLLEIRDLKVAELAALEADIAEAQARVDEKWDNEGIQHTRINGRTLYRRSTRLARFTTKNEELLSLLEDNDLSHLITRSTYANDRSLLGWLNKEAPQDSLGQPVIPEFLAPYVWTDIKHQIVVRRS